MVAAGLLVGAAALIVAAGPPAGEAQPAAKVYQVAWLSGTAASGFADEMKDAFRERLRDLGWVEGRNIHIVYRHADGRTARLPEIAAELVRMNVDVIVATAPGVLAAARNATKTIPIVMVYGPDPVEAGLVRSLARPGGNITGLTSLSADLSLKQFELLKEMVPGLARVAVLWNPANPWHATAVKRIAPAARALGLRVQLVAVREAADLAPAFAAMSAERAGGVLSLADPLTFTHRARVAELALVHRLPTMNGLSEYVDAGGLASYWPNSVELFRRAADYVHRILGGARPSDLPIEQPTKFELVVNMKTAKALGLAIPRSFVLRADRLVE
jgi:putative ABC transport system substrate-binding protein